MCFKKHISEADLEEIGRSYALVALMGRPEDKVDIMTRVMSMDICDGCRTAVLMLIHEIEDRPNHAHDN